MHSCYDYHYYCFVVEEMVWWCRVTTWRCDVVWMVVWTRKASFVVVVDRYDTKLNELVECRPNDDDHSHVVDIDS